MQTEEVPCCSEAELGAECAEKERTSPSRPRTSDFYKTCNLPKRFDHPAWFYGYGIQRKPDIHPCYRTTSSDYGRYFGILLTWIGINIDICSTERNKRFIYYPYGGSYKLVIGFGIPIKIPAKHQTLSIAHNIQFQYPQITNLTQIQGGLPPTLSRKRRFFQGLNEWMITYKAIEILMQKYGINGKACLLRSICENAMYSLHHNANGLYGQLLHIILTPNYGSNTDNEMDLEYIEAKNAGEYGVNCLSLYSDCSLGHGLLDLISTLE